MKTTIDIINDTAIEAVCPNGLKPKTPTEISMVGLFKEFGIKLVDRLVKEKKFITWRKHICSCPVTLHTINSKYCPDCGGRTIRKFKEE